MPRKKRDSVLFKKKKKEERFCSILVMKDNNKIAHTLKFIGHKLLFLFGGS